MVTVRYKEYQNHKLWAAFGITNDAIYIFKHYWFASDHDNVKGGWLIHNTKRSQFLKTLHYIHPLNKW